MLDGSSNGCSCAKNGERPGVERKAGVVSTIMAPKNARVLISAPLLMLPYLAKGSLHILIKDGEFVLDYGCENQFSHQGPWQ